MTTYFTWHWKNKFSVYKILSREVKRHGQIMYNKNKYQKSYLYLFQLACQFRRMAYGLVETTSQKKGILSG